MQFIQSRQFVFGLLIFGGLLRLVYCFKLPLYTTDLLRNIGYGQAFHTYGFKVYDLTPFDLSPSPIQFLWPDHHFTYPWVTLLFFGTMTTVHTSLVWFKFIFCILDGINTYVIHKITKDKSVALLYWLNPIVILYGSYEGQFESFVVFWMVLAVYALHKRNPYAYGFLGLAIQTKLFPVFLVPLFLARMSWKEPKRLALEWGWGILSVLPTVWVMYQSHYLTRLFSPGYIPKVNPMTWNINDQSFYAFYPYWLVLGHFLLGFAFILIILFVLNNGADKWQVCGALIFIVFIKLSQIGQLWYLILLPAFCIPITDVKLRRILVGPSAATGIRELYTICIGPLGYANPPEVVALLEKIFYGF